MKRKKKLKISDDEIFLTMHSDENIENDFINTEEKRELFNKINSLDNITKKVMYFRIYGNLSFKEIGTILRQK